MLTYPQLTTALAQFPLVKRRRLRTVENALADGGVLKSPDPGAETIEWTLRYQGLADAELAALEEFFTAAEGSLNAFTFADPTANLLARSEELRDVAWSADPQLQLTGGIADAMGGVSGWQIHNAGGATQVLRQELQSPASYLYCFSVYLRADTRSTATLMVGTARAAVQVETQWKRVWLAAKNAEGASTLFGIELLAGGTVEVFGPQVEPQACASKYRRSTTGGVYQGARLRDDEFSFTTTDRNRHSATVNVTYANHL
jgi:hypothetical protein